MHNLKNNFLRSFSLINHSYILGNLNKEGRAKQLKVGSFQKGKTYFKIESAKNLVYLQKN